LDFYWKEAIKNLDAEADAFEFAFIQQGGLQEGLQEQMPDMPDASLIASTSSSLA